MLLHPGRRAPQRRDALLRKGGSQPASALTGALERYFIAFAWCR